MTPTLRVVGPSEGQEECGSDGSATRLHTEACEVCWYERWEHLPFPESLTPRACKAHRTVWEAPCEECDGAGSYTYVEGHNEGQASCTDCCGTGMVHFCRCGASYDLEWKAWRCWRGHQTFRLPGFPGKRAGG